MIVNWKYPIIKENTLKIRIFLYSSNFMNILTNKKS